MLKDPFAAEYEAVGIFDDAGFRLVERHAPLIRELFRELRKKHPPSIAAIRKNERALGRILDPGPRSEWFEQLLLQPALNRYGPSLGQNLSTFDRFLHLIYLGRILSDGIEALAGRPPSRSSGSHAAPLVSIIIVAWNGWNDTKECLASLFALTRNPPFEVILVDNASSDETREQGPLLEQRFPNFRYIRSDSNLGFSGGNNLGVDHAAGRYLLFLNNDVLIQQRTWLRSLVEPLEADPCIGATGQFGVVDIEDEAPSAAPFYQGVFMPGITVPVAWLSGYCILIRREAFEAAGRWRADLYGLAGYEDIHLGYAIRRAGWPSVVPSRWIPIFHKIGRTRQKPAVIEALTRVEPSMDKAANFRAHFGNRRRRANYAESDAEAVDRITGATKIPNE